MSEVSKVGGANVHRTADADDENNEGGVTREAGHIENKAFYGPGGAGATNESGVARVEFVQVGAGGKVDPNVKLAPAKDGPKSPEDLMKQPGDDLLRQFREGDEGLFKALQGSNGPTILMKIQTALSDESRMFSMLSNLQATDHETKKSIINNMRA